MNTIHWLSDGPAGRPLLGGKGESLAALVSAGFRVPDGFVITTAATAGQPFWTDTFNAEFEDAWGRLTSPGVTVAIRSSATAEDSGEASFAGQHETILDVVSPEAAREAIDSCLASLHSESARAYRERFATPADLAMAVVVQRYIPARCAGVAFSIDPTTGDAETIVVEAVAGPGETLVSGRAEAERVTLSRGSLAVRERSSPDQQVLSDADARTIAGLALDAEGHFGAPQDIEFVIDEQGATWILQSRPVTVANGAHGEGWRSEFDTETSDRDVWTNANIQEVLPGLLTPLSMNVGADSSQRAFVDGYRKLGLIGKDETPPWIGFFYNRAYLHVGTTRLLAERAIAGSGDDVEMQYLGGQASADIPRQSLRRRLPFMARSIGPLLRLTFGAAGRTERLERIVVAEARRRLSLEPSALEDPAIVDLMESGTALSGEVLAHHLQVSGLAGAAYSNLVRVLRPVTGEETATHLSTLLGGLQNVESARISVDLWNLSRVALETGVAAGLQDAAFDPYAPDLPDGWRAAFRSFMRAHGHRAMREMEASTRSWRAEPAPVLATVRRFLDLDPERSPMATLERQARDRMELTQSLHVRMGFARRQLFNRFLSDAQAQVAHRERTKSIVVRAARMSDEMFLEIGKRLADRGVLEKPDDLYFLTYGEIVAALKGDASPRRGDVTRRRREFERNRHVELPERFRGHPAPLPAALPGDAESLTGLGVSRGAVTGRARVIRDPAVDEPLEPGEILVAPVTDAGWTPLFGLAAGIVVDIGSALSHGSTVAREYGLPAVVNVKNGTRVIRSGDLINVDGAAGKVTILERSGEPPGQAAGKHSRGY